MRLEPSSRSPSWGPRSRLQHDGCKRMMFPDGDLSGGAAASREFASWCLRGQPAVGRDVPIAKQLFRRPTPQDALPLFRTILSAAKGSSDVQLRMLLFLLFAQSTAVGASGVPTSAANWARLVGLPLGTRRQSSLRRVGNARKSLERRSIIRRGRGSLITWVDPFSFINSGAHTDTKKPSLFGSREPFLPSKPNVSPSYHHPSWDAASLAVPAELWANGWVSGLSAKSLVVYLIVLNHKGEKLMSHVPKIRLHQYGMSADLWTPAIEQLSKYKLLRTHNLGTAGAVKRLGYEVLDATLQQLPPPSLLK